MACAAPSVWMLGTDSNGRYRQPVDGGLQVDGPEDAAPEPLAGAVPVEDDLGMDAAPERSRRRWRRYRPDSLRRGGAVASRPISDSVGDILWTDPLRIGA